MTPEELDTIRQACDAARERPWKFQPGFPQERAVWIWQDTGGPARHIGEVLEDVNAHFIANARSWLPQLLDYVDELEESLERCRNDDYDFLHNPLAQRLMNRVKAEDIGKPIHIPRVSDLQP